MSNTPPPNSGTGNVSYVQAVQAIRGSGAAGKHLNRADRRSRTRQAKLEKAIREANYED